MRFTATGLDQAVVVEIEPRVDARGFFARTICRREFEAAGLPSEFVQTSVSFNRRRGTLRGLHFQLPPAPEPKLVRCSRGAIFDVCVDLRAASPTFGRWFGIDLDADNHRALFVPAGFAHGFQTLTDNTEVIYSIAAYFEVDLASGVLWNDPDIAILWPVADPILSDADRARLRLRDLGPVF